MAAKRLVPRLITALMAAACAPLLIEVAATLRRGEPAVDGLIRWVVMAGALYAFPLSLELGRTPNLIEILASSPAQRFLGVSFAVIAWAAAALALLALWRFLSPRWISLPGTTRRIALTAACAGCLIWLASSLIPPPGPARIEVDAGRGLGPMPATIWNFSQGGHTEMRTPGYFEAALDRLSTISPRLIRIDHVYDYYDVVAVDARGQPHYDWSKLDRVVEAIRQTGAEPLICLSYMPAALNGGDPYGSPSDLVTWEALVYQTVRHYNVERRDGIRYWEVWNEPNTGNFWHGSIDEYLALYEASARGVKRAEPSARVGGPGAYSVARYGPAFELIHEKSFIDALTAAVKSKGLPLDFVSWHLYEKHPEAYPENIRRHQAWLAGLTPPPELLITEWNWDARPTPEYETGATNAFIAATAAALNDSPLTAAFFFEPVDSAAGEWGLLRPDGSPKPAYDVFEMLSALRGDRLAVTTTSPDVGAMAALDGGSLRIVAWNVGGRWERPADVRLTLRGLPGPGPYSAEIDHGGGERATADLRAARGALEFDIVIPAHGVRLMTVRIGKVIPESQ